MSCVNNLKQKYENSILFRSLFGHDIGIECSNTPLPMSVMDEIDFMDTSRFDFGIIYTIGTCIPFLTSYFAFVIVRERSSQFKKLQHISGVSIQMYWIVNGAWDYATYIVYIMVFSVSFLAVKVKGFEGQEVLITFGLLLFYGISGIAFVYVLSYLFRDEFYAFITTTVINLILGVYCYDLITRLLRNYYKMKIFFIFFPQFAIVDAIHLIFQNGYINQLCQDSLDIYENDEAELCKAEYMCCGKLF